MFFVFLFVEKVAICLFLLNARLLNLFFEKTCGSFTTLKYKEPGHNMFWNSNIK